MTISLDHPAPPDVPPKQSEGDHYLAVLGLIERHLGRIANVLEALSPEPAQFVKDLGAVRTVPKPKNL